ncbi:MAG: hypothetical protein HY892_06865 [Deltaproteobacteria bacterium]|nr:hypothetical protein [Deltaproteobacteria bacterium]
MLKAWKVMLLAITLLLAGSAWAPTEAAENRVLNVRSDYHRGGYGYYHRPYRRHYPYYPRYHRPYPYRGYYPYYYRYRPYPYYYFPPLPLPYPYYPGW